MPKACSAVKSSCKIPESIMPQRHEGTKAEWIEISLDETLCLGACLSVQAGLCGKKLSENFCRAGNMMCRV
jgi:hypothetical protein